MQYNRQLCRKFLSGVTAAIFVILSTALAPDLLIEQEPLLLQPCNAEAGAQKEDAPPNLKPIENLANAWLKRPELQHSLIGLEIMHIPSATVLFSHNGRRRFVPASTTKVFTTACAMDMLGPNYKYTTKLKVYGTIKNGHLDGSLFIEPSQDPTLSTEQLKQLLGSLRAKGLKSVEGKIDIVSIAGGGDRFATSWLAEDWGQDWMPVPSDLVIDDNTAHRDPARGYPLVSYANARDQNALVSSLLTSSQGPSWICFHPSSKTMQFWHPSGPAVGGQIVGNPAEYNLAIAESILKSMGIKVKGRQIPLSIMEKEPTTVFEMTTGTLSEIIRQCLKTSDNLYAQQLLRTLGTLPSVSRDVEKATLEERGIARINAWVTAMGVPSSELVLWDGCGLSRKNCFTPHALNMVHRHMAGAHLKSAYLDVMPLDGSEAKGSFNGTFRYKTGSMDSVRTISGVLITAAGEPLAVTIMINAHSPSIRELRSSMASLINHLQGLGSLRYEPVPVTPVVIKAKAPAAARIKKPVVRAKSAAPARTNRARRRRAH